MRRPIPTLLTLVVIGGVAGFALSKVRPREPAGEQGGEDIARSDQQPSALTGSNLRKRVATDAQDVDAALDSETLAALWLTFDQDRTTRGFVGRQMLIARWAEVDPDGAVAFFAKEDPRRNRGLLKSLFVEWALIDPQAAADGLAAADLLRINPGYVQELVLRSPERALELVLITDAANEHDSYPNRKATRAAFEMLFAKDKAKALEKLDEFPARLRPDALEGIATAMAKRDIAAAQEWAEGFADPEERLAALGPVVVELGKRDPDAALPFLSEFEDPFMWNRPGGLLLRALREHDPRFAIEWASKNIDMKNRDSMFGHNMIYSALQEYGPEETLRIIAATENEKLRENFMIDWNRRMWARDPAALLPVVDQLESREQRAEFRAALVPSLARSDMRAAMEYLDSLPPGENGGEEMWVKIFGHDIRYRFDEDPEVFWDVVQRLPDDKQQKFMAARIEQIARSQPAEAAATLERLRDHPAREQLLSQAGGAMWQRDPAAAQDWVESLQGADRSRAATGLASAAGFAGEFGPETLRWLRSMDVSDRDMVRATRWVQRVAGQDPEQAIAIIGALGPGPAQQSAIYGLVEESIRRDPELARAWIGRVENADWRDLLQRRLDRP